MEPTRVLEADYLDIIYDNRNKEYGGYELRKHYNRRMGKAALFFFLGLGALASMSFISTHPAERIITNHGPIVMTDIQVPEIPQIPPKILPPSPPPPAANTNTHTFVVPKIVHNEEAPVDAPPSMPKTTEQPGTTTTTGTKSTGIGTDNTGICGKGNIVVVAPAIPEPPAKWVQQMPLFDGDMNAYISSHIKYPTTARDEGIEGQVVIQFVVNEDGAVSDAKVILSVGGGCDEEALRMVNNMPKWKPGKQNGKAVKVYFTIPIKFVLN